MPEDNQILEESKDEEQKENQIADEESKEPQRPSVHQVNSNNQSLIDSFVGKYKTEKDLKIGDRQLSDLIETCEKNNKKYLNVKKFENQC